MFPFLVLRDDVMQIPYWIKNLKRSDEIVSTKLVNTYGAKFSLQDRDGSMEILFKGTEGINGICQQLENCRAKD